MRHCIQRSSSMNCCALVIGAGVTLALATLAPGAASAARSINLQARTAGQLAELCAAPPTSPENDSKVDFCHGFAQGAVDVILGQSGQQKPFCFPRPVPSRAQT